MVERHTEAILGWLMDHAFGEATLYTDWLTYIMSFLT